MSQMHANSHDLHQTSAAPVNAEELTYAHVVRDPRFMEALVRDAHRARSEAIGGMLAAAFDALANGARRMARAGSTLLSGAARHVHAASVNTNPPARRC